LDLDRVIELLDPVRNSKFSAKRIHVCSGGKEPSGESSSPTIDEAGVVIELEPFRETSHVLLMEAHAAAGNTAQAHAPYERLRAKLADELGASPSPETESASLEILRANE
jgi:Bacterial transcriptional activator domain